MRSRNGVRKNEEIGGNDGPDGTNRNRYFRSYRLRTWQIVCLALLDDCLDYPQALPCINGQTRRSRSVSRDTAYPYAYCRKLRVWKNTASTKLYLPRPATNCRRKTLYHCHRQSRGPHRKDTPVKTALPGQ